LGYVFRGGVGHGHVGAALRSWGFGRHVHCIEGGLAIAEIDGLRRRLSQIPQGSNVVELFWGSEKPLVVWGEKVTDLN
jgi:hypothetical protein